MNIIFLFKRLSGIYFLKDAKMSEKKITLSLTFKESEKFKQNPGKITLDYILNITNKAPLIPNTVFTYCFCFAEICKPLWYILCKILKLNHRFT